MKKTVTNLVRHLILIDSEVIDEDDLNQFKSLLTELDRDVIVNIGSNKNFVSTISLLSRINSGLSSNEWNSYLEDMLSSLIRTQRPSSFIFIGKYPYAGITGMLRRVGKSSRTLWIPVRAKEESLTTRSERFGFVSSPETWQKIIKPAAYSHNLVYLHEGLADEYRDILEIEGVEVCEYADQSGILLMPSKQLSSNWPLLEGKIVITIGESTDFIKNLPEYLRSKNVHLNTVKPEEVCKIVKRINNSEMISSTHGSASLRRKVLFQSIVDSSFKGF